MVAVNGVRPFIAAHHQYVWGGYKWIDIIMDDGWVYPLVTTLPSFVINLWWIIVMNDWNLDEKSLGMLQ